MNSLLHALVGQGLQHHSFWMINCFQGKCFALITIAIWDEHISVYLFLNFINDKAP